MAEPLAYEPALSPDAQQIAFVSGGDIWLASSAGGEAKALVSHAATDGTPIFSPDGKRLVFSSNRSGNGDVYVLDLMSQALTRLTYDDRPEQPSGWSADGQWVYFHSVLHDIQRMNDIYRVRVRGGMPMPVVQQRYVEEKRGVASPDGRWLALNTRGFDQWWRRGGAHIDQEELWLAPLSQPGVWQQLHTPGKHAAWPQWSVDGQGLYYVGRPDGVENVFYQPVAGQPKALTHFKDGRVVWPSLSANGEQLAFERDYRIWTVDVASGRQQVLSFTLADQPVLPAPGALKLGDKLEELLLSPTGQQLAFIARGEVWLSPITGGTATRLTQTGATQSQLAWSPDGSRLAYVSMRNGVGEIWQYDLARQQETRLTQGDESDAFPCYAPDGQALAFMRNGRALYRLDMASGQSTLLATTQTGRPPIWADSPLAWSPDGQWLAWVALNDKLLAQVMLVGRQGGVPQSLTQLASPGVGKKLWFRPEDQGYGQASLIWQGDGRTLWWRAFQHAEQGGRWVRIDLAPPAVLQADGEPVKQALRPDASYALAHHNVVPLSLDTQYGALAADGKTFALVSLAAGQPNIWRWRIGEPARQLTASAGTKHFLQLTVDGEMAYYLEGGKPFRVSMAGGQAEAILLDVVLTPDFAQEKQAIFRESWRLLQDFFYDSAMHRQSWAALQAHYQPLVNQAATRDELRRVILLMIGELNSSHTGLSAPKSETQTTLGRLALDFDRSHYEQQGHLRIASVVADGPAAQAGLQLGDIIRAVDGKSLTATDNLDALLDGKIGKIVQLIVDTAQAQHQIRYLKPINFNDESTLRYKQWVTGRRIYVDRASGGKLGYVHLIDMRENSLDQFHLDLDRTVHSKQGLVLDARNNYGGMVDSWVLDTLSRRSHFTFTTRQLPTAPGRLAVGQQTLEKSTVLVTNKWTLSDGEVLTEGYRAQRLGQVVGEPGAGWVIFTSFKLMVDGSFLRLPFGQVVSTAGGGDLETTPRKVDQIIFNRLGDEEQDPQLDAAVTTLLKNR
ncbi:S41 family peptidase [Chitinivorax sp. B]|uniref:S41 family peptidase n=1 Tax=Chitinivorax sp. B TaxID=2502235 RepID=UPI001485AB24|nr:S41 family peptidase [Chitinivorax sp. B]